MTRKAPQAPKRIAQREEALCEALVLLTTTEEAQRFLVDLCTPAELRALADRWYVARLVARDQPYREIQAQTGVSTATVTRVARALRYGEGGYRRMLEKVTPPDRPRGRRGKPNA